MFARDRSLKPREQGSHHEYGLCFLNPALLVSGGPGLMLNTQHVTDLDQSVNSAKESVEMADQTCLIS